jgi:hypothetical protein
MGSWRLVGDVGHGLLLGRERPDECTGTAADLGERAALGVLAQVAV